MGVRQTVTVTEAKTQLSHLIELVASGEEVVIRRGRSPIAKLVRYDPPVARRVPGDLRGRIWVSDDFDERDEDIERLFGTRD